MGENWNSRLNSKDGKKKILLNRNFKRIEYLSLDEILVVFFFFFLFSDSSELFKCPVWDFVLGGKKKCPNLSTSVFDIFFFFPYGFELDAAEESRYQMVRKIKRDSGWLEGCLHLTCETFTLKIFLPEKNATLCLIQATNALLDYKFTIQQTSQIPASKCAFFNNRTFLMLSWLQIADIIRHDNFKSSCLEQ